MTLAYFADLFENLLGLRRKLDVLTLSIEMARSLLLLKSSSER